MAFRTLLFLFFAILLVNTMVSAEELEGEKSKKPKVYGDEKFEKNWHGLRPCVRKVPGRSYPQVVESFCYPTNPEEKPIQQGGVIEGVPVIIRDEPSP
ncbi:hypothetical protein RchiOBHm_Chr2g0170501 [Rosa chinensis]|uniref:Uncharacterized protein n=1 Tax=Rosa chinensis TaxID=74649 RepID=A0A2P6S534_ROSCH|nr:hypothetical protein RchiOBHm_Chr2g0170501 [Rosa chinensis]